MNNISNEDRLRIKELFFNRGYGIDDIAHKYRRKYKHVYIRECIFDLIEQGV